MLGGKGRHVDAMLCLPRHLIINKEIHKGTFIVLYVACSLLSCRSPGSGRARLINQYTRHGHLGRAVAEGFSPTSPRAHWIGPEQGETDQSREYINMLVY